jgi:hypothetical protein
MVAPLSGASDQQPSSLSGAASRPLRRKEHEMKHTGLSSAAALAAAGLLTFGAAVRAEQGSSTKASSSGRATDSTNAKASSSSSTTTGQGSQHDQQQSPPGFVLIEERYVYLTASEPQNHFLRAGQLWAAGNDRAAAGEVRVAADYLDMQSSQAQGKSKQSLTSAAQKLRDAAKTLRPASKTSAQQGQQQQQQASGNNGNSDGLSDQDRQMQQKIRQEARELTDAFAGADYALAEHFQDRAQDSLQKKTPVVAGHELGASADALTAAFAWAGEQPSQDTLKAISQARQIADRLLSGENAAGEAQTASASTSGAGSGNAAASGDANKDAGQAMQALGSAIESSEKQILTTQHQPSAQADTKSKSK